MTGGRCWRRSTHSPRISGSRCAFFIWEERSYKEIAREIRRPVGTVMSRLARGRAQLRNRLNATSRANGAGNTATRSPSGEFAFGA
ncbi:MAG: hypothetical protein HC814_00095 [Rhodobacteraceae bacterium]|nr:hypothetical protein [Paracoccaceae bacterium]